MAAREETSTREGTGVNGRSRTVDVGKGITVTFSLRLGEFPRVDCYWEPYLPRKLSRRQMQRYEAGRNAILVEMMPELIANTEKGKADV